MFTGIISRYRRYIKGGRAALSRGRAGKRPKNLVIRPELLDLGTGRRVALIGRRIEDGMMAAGGAAMKSVDHGGGLLLIGPEGRAGTLQAIRRAFTGLDPEYIRHVPVRDGSEDLIESLRELVTDGSAEIVFAPSPIEDRGIYRHVAEVLGGTVGRNRSIRLLLYEIHHPLLPNGVVDITGVMARKESLGQQMGGIDLFHALNQYRSVMNMKGRGFAEAFHSISMQAGTDNPAAGSIDPDFPETRPIPFFRGTDLLSEGKVERWREGEGKERVLVLSPHFDDETIGCGGTLLRHAHRGDRTSVLFFTDGREGDPRESDRDLVSAMRKRESAEAGSLLGVGRTEFLDRPETRLRPEEEVERRVEGILDEIDPDLVYLPSFLENHVDHIELNRIFYRILKRRMRRLEIRMFGLWTVIPGNLIVDIDEVIEEKIRAVNAYRSQITQVDYLSVTIALNRYWSLRYSDGAGYLEIFHVIGSEEYCSIIERLGIDREIL